MRPALSQPRPIGSWQLKSVCAGRPRKRTGLLPVLQQRGVRQEVDARGHALEQRAVRRVLGVPHRDGVREITPTGCVLATERAPPWNAAYGRLPGPAQPLRERLGRVPGPLAPGRGGTQAAHDAESRARLLLLLLSTPTAAAGATGFIARTWRRWRRGRDGIRRRGFVRGVVRTFWGTRRTGARATAPTHTGLWPA